MIDEMEPVNSSGWRGINVEIQHAPTVAHVNLLLARVKTFRRAHPRTLRRAEKLGKARIAELGAKKGDSGGK